MSLETKNLKIAFVIPQFDPSRGGVERYAFDLASGLVRRGQAVHVFTQLLPTGSTKLPKGLQVTRVVVPEGSNASRYRRFDAAVRDGLADLSDWDIVQGFGQTTLHNVYRVGGGTHPAYLRAMEPYWPFWKRAWEKINPKNRMRIATERQIYAQPGLHYIANSQRTKDEVCADYGVDPERIQVIHNGTDLQAFHPRLRETLRASRRAHYGLDAEAFVLAFVGSGFARKGLRFAIGITARLHLQGVPALLLVAGRDASAKYRRQARRLGIESAVRFLGSVSDVESVYAASDAFVFPSLYEPFGIAPLEALACGLPLVITQNCGVSEMLEDGREGCLLERPDEVERAAAFLLKLARDPALLALHRTRARQAAETLDIEKNIDRVLALYQGLVASGAARKLVRP